MPDVTQAEVGRRLYHVHREKRVEQAIKKIQQGLGAEWRSFSEDDIYLLGHLLQCTWNTIDQKIWEKISFASIKKNDIRKILLHGEGVGPGKNPDQAAVTEIKKLLLSIQ
jgi:ribosomal protein L31E